MNFDNQLFDVNGLIQSLQNTIITLNNTIESLQESLENANKTNASLQTKIDEQSVTISAFQATIEELTKQIANLSKEGKIKDKDIQKLTSQVNRNSSNSSIPPSKDTIANKEKLKKERKTRSLRSKSDKKPGGQKGHAGTTAAPDPNPDKKDIDIPDACPKCGHVFSLDDIQLKAKQVFSLDLKKIVVEYIRGVATCPECGHVVETTMPDEAVNPVNYDSSVKTLVAYLANFGMISVSRIQEFLEEFSGFHMSQGTISSYTQKMVNYLQPVKEYMIEKMLGMKIWHTDETGIYIEGERWWLHTIVSGPYVLFFIHRKRGNEALKDIGLLERYRGTVVHDNWASYQLYDNVDHVQCMVHVLRTLQSCYDQYKEDECKKVMDYIQETYELRNKYLDEGKEVFDNELSEKIEGDIKILVSKWKEAHLKRYPIASEDKKRGKPARDDAIRIIDRLLDEETEDQYYGWIHDFTIPFTNNEAERSFRLEKIKQAVSGCFRSESGAKGSCDTYSFIQTIRSLGLSVKEQLNNLINGQFNLQLLEG